MSFVWSIIGRKTRAILGARTIVNAHVGSLSTAFHLVLLSTILAVFKGVVLLSTDMQDYCQRNGLVNWYRLDFPAGWPPAGIRAHPYESRLG